MVRDEVRQHDQPKQVGAWLMHINHSIEGLTAHRKPGAGSASRLVKAIKDIVGWETCLVFKGEDSDCIKDVAVCIKWAAAFPAWLTLMLLTLSFAGASFKSSGCHMDYWPSSWFLRIGNVGSLGKVPAESLDIGKIQVGSSNKSGRH
jgi:hypothetical protein